MKAHIRKMPIKETYLMKLTEVLKEFGEYDISPEFMDKLGAKLKTDEYYQKMKEAFGGGKSKEDADDISDSSTEINSHGHTDNV